MKKTYEAKLQQTRGFQDTLNTSLNNGDVLSRLRSYGVPVYIRDTPKKFKSLHPNGITIAPNIIKKMEADEVYAQEIITEIEDFLFNFYPESKRGYEQQGAKINWCGISIDAEGKVVKWAGGLPEKEEDDYQSGIELYIFTGNEKESRKIELQDEPNILISDDSLDWSAYLSLVGDTSYKIRRQSN